MQQNVIENQGRTRKGALAPALSCAHSRWLFGFQRSSAHSPPHHKGKPRPVEGVGLIGTHTM